MCLYFLILCILIPTANSVLELGAQWIHGTGDGQNHNPLYDIADERDLISRHDTDVGVEGKGDFRLENGEKIDCDVIEQVIAQLDEIKQSICDNKFSNKSKAQSNETIHSVGFIFKDEFKKYISEQNFADEKQELVWSIFDWYVRFDMIDNACNDLNHL